MSVGPRVEMAGPDQRCDVSDRSRPRQRKCVVSAVVEPLAVDERDGRLEDRHAPLERVRRGLVGIAPPFRPPLQPFHIVT